MKARLLLSLVLGTVILASLLALGTIAAHAQCGGPNDPPCEPDKEKKPTATDLPPTPTSTPEPTKTPDAALLAPALPTAAVAPPPAGGETLSNFPSPIAFPGGGGWLGILIGLLVGILIGLILPRRGKLSASPLLIGRGKSMSSIDSEGGGAGIVGPSDLQGKAGVVAPSDLAGHAGGASGGVAEGVVVQGGRTAGGGIWRGTDTAGDPGRVGHTALKQAKAPGPPQSPRGVASSPGGPDLSVREAALNVREAALNAREAALSAREAALRAGPGAGPH